MEKRVWLIGGNRIELEEMERQVNACGEMQARCVFSLEDVEALVAAQNLEEYPAVSTPSLIVVDYEMVSRENFKLLSVLKKHAALAGVPLFYMTEVQRDDLENLCYAKGAMAVLTKPFTQEAVFRMKHAAEQYEMTKKYERSLQKQTDDLQFAREMKQRDEQLAARNQLLYQIYGRRFSDEMLDKLLEKTYGTTLGGEKIELTVMMADLRGFTSLSEELETDEVMLLLNFFFEKMTECISKYDGTIIEFLGDAVLAVFGAPIALECQTECAIAAAIEMQNAMDQVNEFCAERNYPVLEMGIGIHRGETFIGNIGSEKMMRYNVIGKVVNECSRIESYSVGGQVLISLESLDYVDCPVELHNYMTITAKGVPKPVAVAEVVGIGGNYQQRIAYVEVDVMKPVKESLLFHMHPIENKMVKQEVVEAKLLQFSSKRALVELRDLHAELKMYSDVEILAEKKNGEKTSAGVYAKVVEHHDSMVTLHFTHTRHDFQKFLGLETGGFVKMNEEMEL